MLRRFRAALLIIIIIIIIIKYKIYIAPWCPKIKRRLVALGQSKLNK